MNDAPFFRTTLAVMAGPIVWTLHFLLIYVVTALACARHFYDLQWFGVGVVQAVIGVATVLAISAIAVIMRLIRPAFAGLSRDSRHFALSMAVGFSLISVLAILWDALPALIVPACR